MSQNTGSNRGYRRSTRPGEGSPNKPDYRDSPAQARRGYRQATRPGESSTRSAPTTGLANLPANYAATERQAFNKARAHDIRTKPSSVTSMVPPGGSTYKPSRDGGNTGRNDTREIPTGGKQTGTNMAAKLPSLEEIGVGMREFLGPSFPTQPETNRITASYPNTTGDGMETVDLGDGTQYLASNNGRIIGLAPTNQTGQFGGSQLPTTNDNPYSGTPAQSPQFRSDLPGITGQSYDSYHTNNGLSAASNVSGKGTPAFTGKEERIEGASSRPRTSLADALNDGSDLRYKPNDPPSESLQNARRSAAFLDSSGDSLVAYRNVLAGMNIKRVGNKDYIMHNGKVQEIGSDATRGIMQADSMEKAQSLKQAYVDGLKSNAASAKTDVVQTPAAAQNPPVTPDGSSPFAPNLPGNQKPNLKNPAFGLFSI